MANVGNIVLGLLADSTGVKKGVDSARKYLKGYQNSIKGLIAEVAAPAAIAGGLWKAVSASSALKEQLSATGITFGAQADQVIAAATEIGDRFGVVKAEFLQAANAFGNIFDGAGISAQKTAEMSVQFTKLGADLSSFANVPVADALLAIQSGLTGEAQPLRRFGVQMDEAAMKAKALEMGLGGANGQLTAAEKILARAEIISTRLAKANGDLERTFDGVANQSKSIWGQITNGFAEIGDRMEPLTKSVLASLNIITGWAVDFGKIVGDVLGWLGRMIQAAQDFATVLAVGSVEAERMWAEDARVLKTTEAVKEQAKAHVDVKAAAKAAADETNRAAKEAKDAADARTKALEKQADAIRDQWSQATSDARSLIDATMTPAERLNEELLKINDLRQNGLIDDTTAARGIIAAKNAANEGKKYQLGGALAAGSAEARSALLAASTQASRSKDDPLKEVASLTRDGLKLDRELNAIMTRVESALKQAIQPTPAVSL